MVIDHRTPATIRDVAEKAGVSTATVSRVLAGVGNPKPDTAAAAHLETHTVESRLRSAPLLYSLPLAVKCRK